MKNLIVIIMFFNLWTVSAETELDRSCFEKSVVLGASISSGYGSAIDLLKSYHKTLVDGGSAVSPIELFLYENDLSDETRRDFLFSDLQNEGVSRYQFGVYRNYYIPEHWGNGKINYLDRVNALKKKMDEANIIFNIDGLYWDSINAAEDDRYCDAALLHIDELTTFAKENQKLLVMGTVPADKKERVMPFAHGAWSEPQTECVHQLNERIEQRCDLDFGCYKIDIFSLVERLNSLNEEDWVEFEGKIFRQPIFADKSGKLITTNEERSPDNLLRSEGIHLTKIGSRYLAKMIKDAFLANPPQCGAQ